MPSPDAAWCAEPLAAELDRLAAPRDRDGAFPADALALLRARGLTAPRAMRSATHGMAGLLRLLAAIGRGDPNVGRLVEGHANAIEILDRLAPAPLAERALAAAEGGALFGVWGADPPEDRLRVTRAGGTLRLAGAKLYCSGADELDGALVLAGEGERRVLLFVERGAGLEVDRSWWRPLGMRASASHLVRFDGVVLDPGAVVCDGDTYLAEPWFSGGAMRFAAVQAGMARGLAETAAAHLSDRGRAEAAHQAARLGTLAAALESLAALLDRAGAAWDAGCAPEAPADAARCAAAHGTLARVAAERAAMETIETAQRAVGLAGLIAPHPLERRLRDAMVYARQPGPDGALEAAGRAFAAGDLAP